MTEPLKLSPSDFAFLYEECKLCYWLKVKHGIAQPQMPFPGIFSTINTKLQTPLVGKNLKSVSDALPDGFVTSQEGFVESKKIPGTNLFIKGKYDLLVKKSDGTYILVDLKISKPDEEKIDKYMTQLAAYKFTLENPVSGEPIKISELGLLVFYPDSVEMKKDSVKINMPPVWMSVPIDEPGFIAFARGIDKLLAGGAPAEGEECRWCEYRHKGERIAHIRSTNTGQ
jgi:CRISPR/Cas system-associated exonuclease Cas4 (RecB family)